MKKVEIRQFSFAEVDAPKETFGFMKIPAFSKLIRAEGDHLEVSDGYHTFDELYDHRITLYFSLCHQLFRLRNFTEYFNDIWIPIWRSKLHSDGSEFEGWFILGIYKEKGKQITYHLPIEKWEETNFAETLEKAPEWDGHTSGDVLERLKNL